MSTIDHNKIYRLSYVLLREKTIDPVKEMFVNISDRSRGIFGWYDWGMTEWEVKDKDIDDGIYQFQKKIIGKNSFIEKSTQELKDLFCDYGMCRSYIDAENILSKIDGKKLLRPFPLLSKFHGLEFKLDKETYKIRTFRDNDLEIVL